MDTRDFFSAVLPSAPNYVLTIGRSADKGGMRFWNRGYHTIDELAHAAVKHDKEGLVVYFAVAAFDGNEEVLADGKLKTGRKAAQARDFRALALDIDVGEGKPYASQRDAAVALAAALRKHSIPPPMIVSSGRGLHCYWPFTSDVSKAKWVATAQQLRGVLGAEGVGIDTTKICDPAMVLRPVGTFNRKNNAALPVRVLRPSAVFDYASVADTISKAAGGTVAVPTGKKSSLLDAGLRNDLPPADPLQVGLKCQQLKAIAETRGANADEPLWYASLGVAAYCENPEQTAIAWSDGHPEYDEGKTLAKMAGWRDRTTGPTTCAKFELLNPGGCAGCPYKGKVSAPTQLSVPKQTTVGTSAGEIPLPRSYRLSGKRIVRVVEDEVIPVCNYPLTVRSRYYDPAEQKMVAELVASTGKEGEKVVHLPIDILAAGGEKLTSFFYNHNIAPGPFDAHIRNTRQYLMSYLEELQNVVKPTETHGVFGWTDHDTSFVLGRTKFTKDGAIPVQMSPSVTSEMQDAFEPTGEVSGWVDMTSFLDEPGLEYHAMCLLIGMGGPLYKFTDIPGTVISMYHKDTGTGKTTIGHMASSVWGNPQQLQIGRSDTVNALFRTLAQLCNIPAFCDEMTNTPPLDASNFVYNVSIGREKRRLDQTSKLKTSGRWAMPVLISTNQSFVGKLQIGKVSSDAELFRLIEYPFNMNSVFNGTEGGTPIGRQMLTLAKNNYGLVGPMLINRYLSIPNPVEFLERALVSMEKEFGFRFQAQERFARAAHVVAYVAAKIAWRLQLIQFDYHRVFEKSLEFIDYTRLHADATRNDAFDILGMFLTENVGSTIVEKFNTTTNITNFHLPLPRNQIYARFEIRVDQTNAIVGGELYLNRAYFRHWCFEKGVDHGNVTGQLKHEGVFKKAERIALGRRSPILTTSTWAYTFELRHSRFTDVVSAFEQAHSKLELDPPPAV